MRQFILLIILGFGGLEIFSYFVHRFLFHGILWRIHLTHHTPRKFFLELNDVFSLFFALVSMSLMMFAASPIVSSLTFPVGLGIAIYGLVYFIAHDLFTHRRFFPFASSAKILLTIRAAHQRHHQSAEKIGIEPYGLFIFNYHEFWRKINKNESRKNN